MSRVLAPNGVNEARILGQTIKCMKDHHLADKGRADNRAIKLLLKSWTALQGSEGRYLDRKAFAEYCGIGETAYSNWVAGATDLSQIEALLRAMERMPAAYREQLFAGILREFPSIQSPAIAHDPVAVHRLREISGRANCITLVAAEREYHSSYVVTALGHAATQLGSSVRKLAGFDFVTGNAFVQVPGVTYVDPAAPEQELGQTLRVSLPKIQPAGVILLNRVLSRLPKLQQEVLRALPLHHVIIGEGLDFKHGEICQHRGRAASAANFVRVSELSGGRLAISFSSL